MTPAEFLRSLDREATDLHEDVQVGLKVKSLLPALADVVEAAEKVRFAYNKERRTITVPTDPVGELQDTLHRLAAAVAEMEK